MGAFRLFKISVIDNKQKMFILRPLVLHVYPEQAQRLPQSPNVQSMVSKIMY